MDIIDPNIQIIPYEDKYQPLFRELNEQWITEHWQLEAHDYECLDHPQESILDHGGHIFVALYCDEPVGVCALCKMDGSKYDYELAKVAINPKMRGKGIGYAICKTAIDTANALGAKAVFLECNTRLTPALATYRKLGFHEVEEFHPAYVRGDIQMELFFPNN